MLISAPRFPELLLSQAVHIIVSCTGRCAQYLATARYDNNTLSTRVETRAISRHDAVFRKPLRKPCAYELDEPPPFPSLHEPSCSESTQQLIEKMSTQTPLGVHTCVCVSFTFVDRAM